ncbi:putative membrane lipoprotein [Salvia divinorum]|uniref:Membrane lipoprotein n=1 Tax=Salvia divinorum TaxID=28513 RepID=A0ABD1I843_SALDI
MACYPSYSSPSSSSFRTLRRSSRMNLSVIFIALLLINTWSSCTAARPGRSILTVKERDHSSMALNYFQEKEKLRNEGLYFSKLPKGVPIPPSAPSKRHNSLPQD